MNKLAIIAAAALSAGTFGLAAIAQDSSTATTTVSDFQTVDANKDGWVSFEEAMGAYPTLSQLIFDQADANKDGNLDEGEFTQLQGLTAGAGDATTSSSDESSSESSVESSSESSAP
ncbi:MAG: hypothetical protein EOP22_10635 [Hyphomicrobiales bacterium]|nr:MAG: hypothetical protein EOP22_10635 [Hyphomicrobiales bacterium]